MLEGLRGADIPDQPERELPWTKRSREPQRYA